MTRDAFFQELLRQANDAGRLPSEEGLMLSGNSAAVIYAREHYVTWDDALADFVTWLYEQDPNSKLLLNGPATQMGVRSAKPYTGTPATVVYYGEPLGTASLGHTPLNELGVVFLFGALAHELGFVVDAIRPGFPDCEAKRRVDAKKGIWTAVRIEFEFRSSGFRVHLGQVDRCDLVVCWEHDWKDCPVEVLELRKHLLKSPAGFDNTT